MMLLWIAVFAGGWFLQSRMARYALRHLRCSLGTEEYLVEPGEPLTVRLTLENRSRCPVFFLRCRLGVPLQAELCPGQRGRIEDYVYSRQYQVTGFLMPRQRRELRIRMTVPARGRYTFTSVTIAAGDFLGTREEERQFPGFCQTVVLPKRAEGTVPPEIRGGLLGERSVRRWIHEDPILSAGFRDYTGREPLKTVSWNRSLQSGRLMVRQMDHTAEEKVTVLFHMDEGSWDDLEDAFSRCRSVCELLEQRKLPYAFRHNGMLMTNVGILPPVESGLGKPHLNRILEGLGGALLKSTQSLERMVRGILLQDAPSCCYLLVVPRVTPEVRIQAAKLEAGTGAVVEILAK